MLDLITFRAEVAEFVAQRHYAAERAMRDARFEDWIAWNARLAEMEVITRWILGRLDRPPPSL